MDDRARGAAIICERLLKFAKGDMPVGGEHVAQRTDFLIAERREAVAVCGVDVATADPVLVQARAVDLLECYADGSEGCGGRLS